MIGSRSNFGLYAALTVIAVIAVAYGSFVLGTALDTGAWIWGNPVATLADVLRGRTPWPDGGTFLLAIGAFVIIVVGMWLAFREMARNTGPEIVRRARHLSNGMKLSRKATAKRNADGKLAPAHVVPGLVVARAVRSGKELLSGWRDSMVVIMGPGQGKTTAVCVPLALQAPGLLLASSNKRDFPDAIRRARERMGQFWGFDPDRIAGYEDTVPGWFWDPLSYVTDESKADTAAHLLMSNRSLSANAKSEPYWDTEGEKLLGRLLLAAAVGNRPITAIYEWINSPRPTSAIELLSAHGYPLASQGLAATYQLAIEQRSGIIGNAQSAVRFLENSRITSWMCRTSGADRRPQLDLYRLVRNPADTLFCLSKSSRGSAAPLTSLLMMAATTAAEEYAEECGGRLPIPATAVLDEVANTVKDPELPNKFSYYPGYGIQLIAILQNPAQGRRAWGEDGMEQLWDAATIRVLGGGVEERKFLDDISAKAGNVQVLRHTRSSGKGGGSTSSAPHEEPRVHLSHLANLRAGYLLITSAHDQPVVARAIPWWKRDKATVAAVSESLGAYQPKVISYGQVEREASSV